MMKLQRLQTWINEPDITTVQMNNWLHLLTVSQHMKNHLFCCNEVFLKKETIIYENEPRCAYLGSFF